MLPINSAINPYLYTIADVVSKYKKGAQANKFNAGTSAKTRSTDINKSVSKSISCASDHQGDIDTHL